MIQERVRKARRIDLRWSNGIRGAEQSEGRRSVNEQKKSGVDLDLNLTLWDQTVKVYQGYGRTVVVLKAGSIYTERERFSFGDMRAYELPLGEWLQALRAKFGVAPVQAKKPEGKVVDDDDSGGDF